MESIFGNYLNNLIDSYNKQNKKYNCIIQFNNLYYHYKTSFKQYIKNNKNITLYKKNNKIKYKFDQNLIIDSNIFNILENALIDKYYKEDIIMFIFINILLYDFDNLKQYKIINNECIYSMPFLKCFNILCDILINDDNYKNLDYIKKASEYNIKNKTIKEFLNDIKSMFNHYIYDSIKSVIYINNE